MAGRLAVVEVKRGYELQLGLGRTYEGGSVRTVFGRVMSGQI
jgi:hypothetical protein